MNTNLADLFQQELSLNKVGGKIPIKEREVKH